MHPDLVGAAGLQLAADVRKAPVARQHLPVSDGAAAVFLGHGHALAIRGMTADGPVDRPGILPKGAVHHGLIDPGEAPVRQLGGELLMGEVILGHDQQARGVFVDPVDDAGALLSADAGETVAAVVQQRVDQGAVGMAGRRMHHHAARFVHNNDVLVLKDDVQGQGLGDQGQIGGRRELDREQIPGAHLVVFLHGRPVQADAAVLQQTLGAAAGQIRHSTRKESVDTLAALLGLNVEQGFVHSYLNSARISSRENSSLALLLTGLDAGAAGRACTGLGAATD